MNASTGQISDYSDLCLLGLLGSAVDTTADLFSGQGDMWLDDRGDLQRPLHHILRAGAL